MSQWEDSTYRNYDSLTKVLGTGLGREPIADSTDAVGRLTLRLPLRRLVDLRPIVGHVGPEQ